MSCTDIFLTQGGSTQNKNRIVDHILSTTAYVHDMEQVFPKNECGTGIKHLGDVMTCPHRLCVKAREIIEELDDILDKAWRYEDLCC